MYSKNNSEMTKYFSSYDLICKYNLKSVYRRPKLTKILVEFSCKENFKAFLKTNELSNSLKIKSLFLLYNFLGYYPFIQVKKKKILKHSKKTIITDISLKCILSTDVDIYNFLMKFFIEIENPLQTDKSKFSTIIAKKVKAQELYKLNKKIKLKKIKSTNFVYTTKVHCYLFSAMELLLSHYFSYMNYKNMKFKINFFFSNFNSNYSYVNTIKNLFLFWTIK